MLRSPYGSAKRERDPRRQPPNHDSSDPCHHPPDSGLSARLRHIPMPQSKQARFRPSRVPSSDQSLLLFASRCRRTDPPPPASSSVHQPRAARVLVEQGRSHSSMIGNVVLPCWRQSVRGLSPMIELKFGWTCQDQVAPSCLGGGLRSGSGPKG